MAFLIAVFISFLFYYGFNGIAETLNIDFLRSLSLQRHFESIGRGVLDSRDLIYFLSVTSVFIALTVFKLESKSVKG